MKVKIVNGKIEKANADDTETYTLVVNGEENNWAIAGRPSDYEFEIVGDKCVIDLDNPTQEGTAALAAHGVQDE